MKYGSVVFDMDGVILDFEGDDFQWKYDAVRKALEELGVDKNISRHELDALLGDRGSQACIEHSKQLGLDPRETWELVAENTSRARARMMEQGRFSLYPGSEQVLDRLRVEELGLGLISNAPEAAVKAVIDYYELRDHFKFFRGVTGFDDMLAGKPNPDHLMLAKAELKRDPYVYVGDAESDLIAAREAGMDSVWLKRVDMPLDVRPDYELEDLSGLPDLIL